MARIILIPAFILHVWAAVALTSRDRTSRTQRYSVRKNLESTFASRTMIFGGVFILLFLIYHLLDFTFGTVNPPSRKATSITTWWPAFNSGQWWCSTSWR